MARQMAATWSDARATFLLEVALDRARMKERLAEALFRERTRRGGGDARRFPQPKMAAHLDYSLRQYQRLEDRNDPSLPSWNDLERIAERLDLAPATIFGGTDEDESSTTARAEPTEDAQTLERLLAEVSATRREVGALREILEELREGPAQETRAEHQRP